MLGPRIKGLPDNHRSKPECLFRLSQLYGLVGNHLESKQLIVQTLELWRERGDDLQVAETLRLMSDASRLLGLFKEGIQEATEALEIHNQLGHVPEQLQSWQQLAWLLYGDKQFDAAEEAALRVIDLSGEGERSLVCSCSHLLGKICHSKGETEKAIQYFKTSLGIASSFDWQDKLFLNNYDLAELFCGENRFDDAHIHVERAKSHTSNDIYYLGRAMELQAGFWYRECKFEEAKSEVLRAADVYERIGATKDLEDCRTLLRYVEEDMKTVVASGQSDLNGELLETISLSTPFNSSKTPFSA